MSDLVLEIIRAIIVSVIFLYLLIIGKKEEIRRQKGWLYILFGFGLILFGMVIDITDNFSSLNHYIIIGDTKYQAFLEKVVGYLFGFILLAFGFWKWMPTIIRLRIAERELKKSRDELELRVEERTVELKEKITERKQAVEALRESEERFRETVELLPSIVIELDINGHFTYVNTYGLETFGYTHTDLEKGLFSTDLFPPSEIERFKDRFGLHLKGENSDPVEYRLHTKDGSTIYVIADSAPIYKDGKIVGVRSCVTPITERKQAEEVLRESEERLRELAELLPETIYEMDERGNLTYVNKSAFDYFKYTQQDFDQGLNCIDMIVLEDRQRAMENVQKILKGEEIGLTEYTALRKDGSTFSALFRSTCIFREGKPVGVRGIIIDISEKKRLEAQIQQAQRMEAIGTLAGGIAHDFNNLLMGIQGRTSLMLLKSDSSHPYFEHFTGIEDYVKSATNLTNQLLGFARGGKYEISPTDLNEVIKKKIQLFGRTRKEINILEEYEEKLWTTEVDRGQIGPVLLNIFVNAWQAMPGGGDLHIQTENVIIDENYNKPYHMRLGKYIKLSVTDTGFGMDEATRQKVFDPFFTTKGIGKGTGLGLASAYGIIKNHSGYIDVYSEKGKGTTFEIYLPATVKEVVKKEKLTEEVIGGTETILFVDDEYVVIDVGQQILETLGYKVFQVRSGKEAVEVYRKNQNKIDMVILDMIMPEMSGGDTYDRFKEINPDIKVLLSSGYSIDGQATDILERGCNGFIQKPFKMTDFSNKIREILDKE